VNGHRDRSELAVLGRAVRIPPHDPERHLARAVPPSGIGQVIVDEVRNPAIRDGDVLMPYVGRRLIARAAHDEGIDFVDDMVDATAALLGEQVNSAPNQVMCDQI
jgi:hypothetical protein